MLARLADIQSEMVRRGALEQERAGLLQRAGAALGVPPTTVTLERAVRARHPGAAKAAMERSAELRGLLSEIAREHGINRALMRQELTFLVAPDPADRPGARGRLRPPRRRHAPHPRPTAPSVYRALDLQA